MRIDVHAHYYPLGIADILERHGGIRIRTVHPDSLEERLDSMDAARVDRQLLSMGALMPYYADPESSRSAATSMNNVYAAAISKQPDRFGAFASLPVLQLDSALDELARCLDMPEFWGVALGTGASGLPIDDPFFDPLWRELDARAASVYLHPGVNNGSILGGADYAMMINPALGSPSEMARCVARLALSGLTRRFPSVRIVVANWGGLLPAGWPHFARAAAAAGHQDALDAIRGMWFDTGTSTEASLISVRDSFGLDRLVLGSDAPYGDLRTTVDLLENSALLGPEDVHRIMDLAPLEALGVQEGVA